MESKKKIFEYWLERNEFDLWGYENPVCFICGTEHSLERCHLIPNALGGSDDCSNIVLLCGKHHRNAPNIGIPDIMINYIKNESEQHCKITHLRHEDLNYILEKCLEIGKRLININNYSEENFKQAKEFILNQFRNNTIYVPGHNKADLETKKLYLKYLSEYNDLEKDYIGYLIKQLYINKGTDNEGNI